MSRVSVILISHNATVHLDRCLAGVKAQGTPIKETILVDNGSLDETVTRFTTLLPDGIVVQNKKNLGFARAANQGVQKSTGELLLLLNTDCFLEKNYLHVLLERLDQNPKLAGVQGKYLLDGDPERIDSLGIEVRLSGVAKDICKGSPDDHRTAPFPVAALCGAAAVFRESALEIIREGIHHFDPRFESYYEDVDLCWRLRRKGFELECVPEAVARHVRGGSQKNHARMHRLAFRNKYFTLLKNQSPGKLLLLAPFIIGRDLVKIPYFLFKEPGVLSGYARLPLDLHRFLTGQDTDA